MARPAPPGQYLILKGSGLMWELYDRLLAALPRDVTVEECTIAPFWTIVKTTAGAGMAMTPPDGTRPVRPAGKMAGMTLADLAAYVRSWNFFEAAAGLAALNSHYNHVAQAGRARPLPPEGGGIFAAYEQAMAGKKVAVIGHFPGCEKYASVCELSILERIGQPGDYPDSACEYLLPAQDFVFITGSALVNKTLPRLLQLCARPFTAVLGPSTTLAPVLFEYGADALLGSVINSWAAVRRIAGEGGSSADLRPFLTRVILEKS
ncbi:MAG: DUF364 domain-containing protein [Gracilibacteraceae bacterium]|jgi:uncharacterized protein (DUF4213/DUF364 family)|nr:DUF364 domain-containing protein [Gracilibacteraceae bacterium]